MDHVVVHQFDPAKPVAGGIDGFIREFVHYAPEDVSFSIVGVDATGRHTLGNWTKVVLGGRSVRFMPVARLDAGRQQRRIPHSLRLIAGLIRYRPEIGHGVIHTQRAELGAAVAVLYPHSWRLQVLQGDAATGLGRESDTLWRSSPRLYHALERFAVRRAQRTVVMSTPAAERLRRLSPTVVAGTNWFDGEIFHWRSGIRAHSTPRVGWAGRLEPPKDPLRAVRVFRALQQAGVRFDAWIAGSGTLADDVARALNDNGLSRDVRVLGLLSVEQLADELSTTDVLLMTSAFEGVPRGALEALACGVPVVAPDVGDLNRFVIDGVNGYLSSDGSDDALAALIIKALAIERGSEVAATVAPREARRVVAELFSALSTGA